MREDEGNNNWFAVESKSFKISVEGEGRKTKFFIIERCRGLASWIRFGEEGMRKLLMGVEACCRDTSSARRSFEWKENGRSFRLEYRVNDARRYLLCSVVDVEGKKHMLFFPEGRGFVKGWSLLAEKIKGLGLKSTQETNSVKSITTEPTKEEVKERNNLGKNQVFSWGSIGAEASGRGCSSMENSVWVDAGDCVPQEVFGILKYSLVGKWKTRPEFPPAGKELEAWARVAWRLEGGIMISYLNEDLLFLEFESPEEAKWVLESGRRSFKGDLLQLEWWSPESGCIR